MSGPIFFDTGTSGGGMAIGGAIAGGATQGSVLFVGAAGVLAQNNAALFWDDAQGFLGIGTNTPTVALDVVGDINATGDIIAVGNIQAAALVATGLTVGGVIYTGISGQLTTDGANLFWDDANNRLGIGTAAPAVALQVSGDIIGDNISAITAMFSPAITDSGLAAGLVVYTGVGGLLSAEAAFAYDAATDTLTVGTIASTTAFSAPSITDSGLTAGRVTFAGVGGLLSDSSSFTYAAATGGVVTIADAATITTVRPVTLQHRGGVPAAGYGVGENYNLDSSTNALRTAATSDVVWTASTNLSEVAEYRLFLRNLNGLAAGNSALPVTASWAVNGATGGTIFITDAATITTTNMLTMEHRSSGAAGVSFGTGILLRGQNSTADGDHDMAQWKVDWVTATAGSERSRSIIAGRTAGGALTNLFTFDGNGTFTVAGVSDIAGSDTTMTVASSVTNGTLQLQAALFLRGLCTTGATPNFALTFSAHTGQTASTESPQWVTTGAIKTWNTGAITTNRETNWTPGTMAFVGASTVTNAVAFAINNALIAGANATFTNSTVFRVGGDVSIGATAAAMTYSVIAVPAHTVTVTGGTTITSNGAFAAVRLGIITVSDTTGLTINESATLFIDGAPVGGGAGPAVITEMYGIDSRAEINKFGVQGATGARLRLSYFYGASPADPPVNMTDIMVVDLGATQVLRVRYNDGGAMKVGDVALV